MLHMSDDLAVTIGLIKIASWERDEDSSAGPYFTAFRKLSSREPKGDS